MLAIKNWLFSQKCILCQRKEIGNNGIFCQLCFLKITIIEKPYCIKCGKSFLNGIPENTVCEMCIKYPREFNIACSIFLYTSEIKKLIVKIKQSANRNLVNACIDLFYKKYQLLFQDTKYIVPVPSHWLRILKRGFNPPDLIAWRLSKLTKIPINRKLKRIKKTAYQHNKKFTERLINVNEAFVYKGKLNNSSVLLVDDVFATGATLNECAKAIKKAGAKKVNCFTMASTAADFIPLINIKNSGNVLR